MNFPTISTLNGAVSTHVSLLRSSQILSGSYVHAVGALMSEIKHLGSKLHSWKKQFTDLSWASEACFTEMRHVPRFSQALHCHAAGIWQGDTGCGDQKATWVWAGGGGLALLQRVHSRPRLSAGPPTVKCYPKERVPQGAEAMSTELLCRDRGLQPRTQGAAPSLQDSPPQLEAEALACLPPF